jgi:RecA/RadA recombinase
MACYRLPPHRSRPERIRQIARERGLPEEDVLNNITVATIHNHEHQQEMLELATGLIAEDDSPYRLVIVDSIMARYRVEFSGRGELSERQQKLGQHTELLNKVAREFKLAVVVTNQVMCVAVARAVARWCGGSASPALSHYAASTFATVLLLLTPFSRRRDTVF